MQDTIIQFAHQYAVPLLIAVAWYLLAGILGSILGKWTTIESWVIANPKRAFVYQLLRGMGLDFKKIASSFKAYAEARSGFPPVIEVRASSEIVPDVGVVKTETTRRVSVKPLVASLLVLLAVSGCSLEAARARRINTQLAASYSAPAPRQITQCQAWDGIHVWGDWTAGGLAAVGAGAGIVATQTDDGARTAAITTGIAAAALGAVAVGVAEQSAATWAERCGQ